MSVVQAAASPALPFDAVTRRKEIPLPSMARPTGGGTTQQQLSKAGILAGLFLRITGTIGGVVGTVNALGMSSIIRRVRLTANSGVDLINISGPGYHWLLRDSLETELIDVGTHTNGRSAVTATGAVLDMYLPIAVNMKDTVGMFMLQNEQSILTLTVDWESDATVTSTGTFSNFSCTPYMIAFTVPSDPRSWPSFRRVHQILEDTAPVTGTTPNTYAWQRGGTILQMIHGLGFGVSGTDAWTRFQWRVQQSDYILDFGTDLAIMQWSQLKGRTRPAGVIPIDLMATSGLGNYGKARDLFNTNKVTDCNSIITPTGNGTLYAVRRQLLTIGGGAAAA